MKWNLNNNEWLWIMDWIIPQQQLSCIFEHLKLISLFYWLFFRSPSMPASASVSLSFSPIAHSTRQTICTRIIQTTTNTSRQIDFVPETTNLLLHICCAHNFHFNIYCDWSEMCCVPATHKHTPNPICSISLSLLVCWYVCTRLKNSLYYHFNMLSLIIMIICMESGECSIFEMVNGSKHSGWRRQKSNCFLAFHAIRQILLALLFHINHTGQKKNI